MSNAVAVGKRLGVQPTLARRVAAAGRNGKRLVTGDAENANRVVGKGLLTAGGRAARTLKPRKGFEDMYTKDLDPLRPANLKLPRTSPYTPGGGTRGKLPRPAQQAIPAHLRFGKAAPGTNGLGMLVPAMRGQARSSLVPQTSATATGQQKGSKLAAFGGTKPATAGMSGANAASTPSAGSAASGASVGGVGKGVKRIKLERLPRAVKGTRTGRSYDKSPGVEFLNDATDILLGRGARSEGGNVRSRAVRKRRYDPEDERRHRQGALAAGSGLGGAALTVSGGRQIARDTRSQRAAKPALDPGRPPEARFGEGWRGQGGRLRKPNAQEALGELMAHDKNMKTYGARVDAYRKLRDAKGAVVRGKPAGKIGAGLALLGAGAQLHRQRREPRFD